MKNKLRLSTIRVRAMEDLLKKAGYKCHHCHLTRDKVLAMLWISLNHLAVLKCRDVDVLYHAIYMDFISFQRGRRFSPEVITGKCAAGQREGNGEAGEPRESGGDRQAKRMRQVRAAVKRQVKGGDDGTGGVGEQV